MSERDSQTSPGDRDATPDADALLQFFRYSHLPPALAERSKPFAELAFRLVASLPRNPERTVALRKLLEAKDCAVRASLFVAPAAPGPRGDCIPDHVKQFEGGGQ